MNILEFSKKIINGVGGLHDFVEYELAVPNYDRDVCVAIWVLKCLANPKCEGSEEAVAAIVEKRLVGGSNTTLYHALVDLFQACADLPLDEMNRMETEISAAAKAIKNANKE